MVTSHELPAWARYRYVLSGYRLPHTSNMDCIRSIFYGCNESFNAITMIFGAFLSFGLYLYALHNDCVDSFDVIVYTTFFASCLIHAPFSIGFHTFRCISKVQKDVWRNLDVSFVLIASALLTFALSAYVFPLYITFALFALSGIIACTGTLILFSFKFKDSSVYYKPFMVGCIALPVLIYLIPMILSEESYWSMVAIGSLLVGMCLYVGAVPERFAPGRFDSFGHSHNIMHLCLIVAHCAEFMFIKSMRQI